MYSFLITWVVFGLAGLSTAVPAPAPAPVPEPNPAPSVPPTTTRSIASSTTHLATSSSTSAIKSTALSSITTRSATTARASFTTTTKTPICTILSPACASPGPQTTYLPEPCFPNTGVCYPIDYYAAQDQGQLSASNGNFDTQVYNKCKAICDSQSQCLAFVGVENITPDGTLATSTCFFYSTKLTSPRQCADSPSRIIAYYKSQVCQAVTTTSRTTKSSSTSATSTGPIPCKSAYSVGGDVQSCYGGRTCQAPFAQCQGGLTLPQCDALYYSNTYSISFYNGTSRDCTVFWDCCG